MLDSKIMEEALQAEKAKRLFDDDPDGALVERFGGNLTKRVEEALIRKFSPDANVREAVRRSAQKLRDELTGKGPPTVVERLAINRVVVAWLDVHLVDLLALEGVGDATIGLSELSNVLDRRRDRCNRRYLVALKALHLLRRAAPSVVFNDNRTIVKKARKSRGEASSAATAHVNRLAARSAASRN